jgi:putative ATP-binding cassette transporter
MDEATAALDDEAQTSMMSLFDNELAGSTLISIAHRAGLDVFHDRTLNLVKSDSGARLVAKFQRPHRKRKPSLRKRLLGKLVAQPE